MKCLFLFFLLASCIHNESKASDLPLIEQKAPKWAVGKVYRERYQLPDASAKIVDNHGEGPEYLLGTRNVRAVLNGVYYRGGSNNKFRKAGIRENRNPLPPEGLESLCKEGFSEAVYLYEENFSTSEKQIHCRTFSGKENTLQYHQVSPLQQKDGDVKNLLKMIYRHVKDPQLGPIYDHCWNGWHASGLVAASALRQFCGFTPEQALNYWILNTDGDSDYPKVRKQLEEFTPDLQMALTPAEKAALCPDPNSLKFAK